MQTLVCFRVATFNGLSVIKARMLITLTKNQAQPALGFFVSVVQTENRKPGGVRACQ